MLQPVHLLGDGQPRVHQRDVKELIPQLSTLPKMFENNKGYASASARTARRWTQLELPPMATDARIFVKIYRQALESNSLKKELSTG